jgi:hypothetical protein
VAWSGPANADAYLAEDATLHTTEIHPTDDGYDYAELKQMLAWRADHA